MGEGLDIGASITSFGTSILGMATDAGPALLPVIGGIALVSAGIAMFTKFIKKAK